MNVLEMDSYNMQKDVDVARNIFHDKGPSYRGNVDSMFIFYF